MILLEENCGSSEQVLLLQKGRFGIRPGIISFFSDMPGDVRRKWSAKEGIKEVMRPSNKGNGLTYDEKGNLLVCEHATSTLVRERPNGKRETLASHYKGKELRIRPMMWWWALMVPFTLPIRPSVGFLSSGFRGIGNLIFKGSTGFYREGGNPSFCLMISIYPMDFASPRIAPFFTLMTALVLISRVFDVKKDGTLSKGRMFFEKIGSGDVEEGFPMG